LAQRREPVGEGLGVGQIHVFTEELQLPVTMQVLQFFEEAGAENRRDSTRTDKKKTPACTAPSDRYRARSRRRARCRAHGDEWVKAEPQVCSIKVTPMRAPKCFGSAAIVRKVSAAMSNSKA